MTIAVLHHLQTPFLGNAAALGDVAEYDLRRGDGLPDLDAIDGIVSLGGEQSAWEPVLAAEVELLAEAVARDIPVLGICLGAQLLAHALGGEVTRSVRAVEWRALRCIDGDDPLAGGLAEPVPALHFNQDVFEPPPGATELFARFDPASCEAFRVGRAWGIQFHPDADAAALERWIATYVDWIPDPGAMRAGHTAAHTTASRAIFERFRMVV